MSYEGRIEFLCLAGHRWMTDRNERDIMCPVCGAEDAWHHAIDDTNGDASGFIPDDVWEQMLISPEETKTCDMGHSHITSHARYRIPTAAELKTMVRTYAYLGNEKYAFVTFEEANRIAAEQMKKHEREQKRSRRRR